jgi:hypothetical protein
MIDLLIVCLCAAKFLKGDEEPLRNGLYVYESAKIYVEYNDDPEEESKSFAEIERTRSGALVIVIVVVLVIVLFVCGSLLCVAAEILWS